MVRLSEPEGPHLLIGPCQTVSLHFIFRDEAHLTKALVDKQVVVVMQSVGTGALTYDASDGGISLLQQIDQLGARPRPSGSFRALSPSGSLRWSRQRPFLRAQTLRW